MQRARIPSMRWRGSPGALSLNPNASAIVLDVGEREVYKPYTALMP